MNDRRSLTLGVVIALVGAFFLLRRSVELSGPAPILLLLGAIFLALSALRSFRGPLLPAGVLLGLGAGCSGERHSVDYQAAGTPVTAAEFAKLARIPIQVVYGDNIPKSPIPDLVADGRRAQR